MGFLPYSNINVNMNIAYITTSDSMAVTLCVSSITTTNYEHYIELLISCPYIARILSCYYMRVKNRKERSGYSQPLPLYHSWFISSCICMFSSSFTCLSSSLTSLMLVEKPSCSWTASSPSYVLYGSPAAN